MGSADARILLPGDWVVTRDDIYLGTILGSCVGIALHCPHPFVAALSHCVLPAAGTGRSAKPAGYVVEDTLSLMLDRMMREGAAVSDIIAKVAGGAAQSYAVPLSITVGEANVAAAESFLKDHRIPIAARRTGGSVGRQVLYHTGSGSMWVRCLRAIQSTGHRLGEEGRAS